MNKDSKVFLNHILERIDRIETYIRDFDEEKFQQDIKTVDAIIRNVEIIGEAATNLSEEFRARNSQVEWRKIIAARNQIIHGYASVNLEIIWSITQNDLPKLKTQIRNILEEELKK